MKKIVIIALVALLATPTMAQKFITRTGYIQFFSSTAVEDIEAKNNQVSAIFDQSSNELVVQMPIRGFKFEKALMQEHFNENYMESEEFPKSTFNGKVTGFDASKKGVQKVVFTGKLTIHGVTKEVKEEGTAEMKDGKLMLDAKFMVKPVDYDIKTPSVVADNIAKIIEVTMDLDLSLKK